MGKHPVLHLSDFGDKFRDVKTINAQANICV